MRLKWIALLTTSEGVGDVDHEPTLTLDLALSEAEALRTWLLKPAQDWTTSLDDHSSAGR